MHASLKARVLCGTAVVVVLNVAHCLASCPIGYLSKVGPPRLSYAVVHPYNPLKLPPLAMDNGSPATDNATNNAATNTLSSTNLVNLVKPLVSSTNPPSEFSRRNPRTLPPLAMNEGSPATNINKAKTNTLSSTNVVKLVEPLVSSTNPPSEFPLRTPPLLNGFPGMENGLGYLLPANVVPWTNPPATRSPASDLLFPSPQMLVEYFKPVPGRTNGPNARVFVPVGFVPPTPAVTTPGSRATYTSP